MVCTGNICRSPMAAGLLRARLAAAGVDARVSTAGMVTEDQPASKHGVTVMRKRGIDISDHRSRRLVEQHLDGVDLVIGMERKHVREVAVLDPDAFACTFTLPELARLARSNGPRREDESVEGYLRRLGSGRSPAELMRSSVDDEVADPYGRSKRAYARTAEQLETLVDIVVSHLFPAS